MNEYKIKYDSNDAKTYVDDFKSKLEGNTTSFNWEDLYWISKLLYVYGDSESFDENIIIDAIRDSFRKGLDVKTNKELFLDASIILSRLYFKYGKYELAINYLMYLVDLLDNIPDWVNAFYAYAQVMSDDHFDYLVVQPKHFFARLDLIKSNKKKEILIAFLEKILSKIDEENETAENDEINKNEENDDESEESNNRFENIINLIIEKAKEFGIEKEINDILNPNDNDFDSLLEEKDSIIEQLLSEIEELKNKTTVDSSEEIARLNNENTSLKTNIESLKSEIASLLKENDDLQKQNSSLLNQLTSAINKNPVSIQEEVTQITTSESFDANGHELLTKYQQNQKILVIGSGENKDRLLQRGKSLGFIERDFEFILDYDRITNIASQKNFNGYAGIICGPSPHSASGIDGENSLITYLEKNYKNVVRSTKQNGKLKLDGSAFTRALENVMRNLNIMDLEVA